MPTKQQEYFKNARTWKQVSTNVPPDMHKALKSQVTRERTMSHVIRELIQQSELMRYGRMARPAWSEELAEDLTALRIEVASLRAELGVKTSVVAEPKDSVAKIMADERDPLASFYEPYPSFRTEEVSIKTMEEELVPVWDESYPDIYYLDYLEDEAASVEKEESPLLPAGEIVPEATKEAEETAPPVIPTVEASEKPVKRRPFAFLEKLEKLPEKLGFGRKSA